MKPDIIIVAKLHQPTQEILEKEFTAHRPDSFQEFDRGLQVSMRHKESIRLFERSDDYRILKCETIIILLIIFFIIYSPFLIFNLNLCHQSF